MKVCIDAGHYGNYNHSPVLSSYYESDMTWKLHNYLANELETYGIEVVKTRPNQATDRELVSRGYASKGCDLFISEHSNAAASESPDYAVVIYMRPNASETYDDRSKQLADKLAKAIGDVMGVGYKTYCKEYIGDRDGNGKQDDEWYGVLQGAKQAKVPAVIAENGFHTNLKDAKWLSKDSNLKKLAKAQAKVIAEWGGVTNKPVVTPEKVKASNYAESKNLDFNHQWTTTDLLNMRDGAGTQYKILTTIPKGTKVRCYGYYSKSKDGAIWLFVSVKLKGIAYQGFCNKGWLK